MLRSSPGTAVYATDKAALAAIIEATQEVLHQLGERRLEQSGRSASEQGLIASMYGALRRVKSQLQRGVLAQRDQTTLELDSTEMPLLASCCARGAELAETRAEDSADPREQEWARRQRDILADHAVMLATGPLPALPLPGITPLGTAVMRGLRARLRQKFAGGAPGTAPASPASPDGLTRPSQLAGADVPKPSFQMIAVTGGADSQSPLVAASSDEDAAPPAVQALVAPPRLKDQQLRTLATMDYRALARAEAAGDYRFASAHLASLLEAAVIDCALARSAELGLAGRPDAWDMTDVAAKLLGERCSSRDRATLSYVFAAQRLLRPALQLHMPLVVTPETYHSNSTFVGVVLRMLGCAALES